jgi:lipopolysaccharide/colanic/teichoic acid biosynthesis glycosyltransferase/uncharacterized protein YbjT (DUF2867 family)
MVKIVLVGASGFVGRNIIPYLLKEKADLVIAGRSPERLAADFPGLTVCGIDDLAVAAKDADLFVNLCVLNNDRNASAAEFRAVNVGLMQKLYGLAKASGAKRFCQISSFQAAGAVRSSDYANSKAEAEAWLQSTGDLATVILRLAAVYGDDQYRGKLGILYKVPAVLRPAGLNALAALRPVVDFKTVAMAVLEAAAGSSAQAGKPETVHVSTRQMDNKVYAFAQMLMDLVFSLAVIALLWWLLLAVYIAIRATSPGPGLFIQDRVGRGGKIFRCYKFRTMQVGTPNLGTHEVRQSSVTRVGAFMRRTKIDELPQVINLIRRDMSIVGPRPCLPNQTMLVAERNARHVLDVLPGITGLAQVQGIDMSTPARLAQVDEDYIALRCLPLDIRLILSTALGRGFGDPAQR